MAQGRKSPQVMELRKQAIAERCFVVVFHNVDVKKLDTGSLDSGTLNTSRLGRQKLYWKTRLLELGDSRRQDIGESRALSPLLRLEHSQQTRKVTLGSKARDT